MVNTLIQYPIVMKVADRARESAERKESELFSRSNERVPDVICLLPRWEKYLCGLAVCHSRSLSYIQIFSPVSVRIFAVNIALLWTFLLSPLLFVKGLNKFVMRCVAVPDPLANTKQKLRQM